MTQPSAQCDLPIRLRGYLHEDQACIAWGWLHAYRSSSWARLMHPRTYAKTQRVVVEALLAQARDETSPTQLVVACAPDDEDTIYGWVCGEQQAQRVLVHFVWTKPAYRRQGIASLLVSKIRSGGETKPVVVSHASDQAVRIVRTMPEVQAVFGSGTPPYLRFNPMLVVNSDFEVAL